ncbi:MAG TPA: YicC/YloC family endoribonuclease, partial [Albitalea sp.]|nr:YicC/YloC family endoribonuclease [Albitalea sp.]
MTGYASATAGAGFRPETGSNAEGQTARPPAGTTASVTVELRSVNGRFLDLSFRMPDELRALEPALRDLLSGALRRGKVELRMNARSEADNAWPQPQPEQLNQLSRLESTVQGWLPKAQPLSVHEVLQWCKGGGATERLD